MYYGWILLRINYWSPTLSILVGNWFYSDNDRLISIYRYHLKLHYSYLVILVFTIWHNCLVLYPGAYFSSLFYWSVFLTQIIYYLVWSIVKYTEFISCLLISYFKWGIIFKNNINKILTNIRIKGIKLGIFFFLTYY